MNRETFRAWLAAKPPDTPVGFTCHSGTCPLAMWLRATGQPSAIVTTSAVHFGGAGGKQPPFPLPEWARRFAAEADARLLLTRAVTAAEALRVLEGVPS